MLENERTDSPHVGDGTLHAWLDGALPTGDSAAVEAHLADCSACSAAAAEARGLIAASTRILSALDDVPGDLIPQAPQRASDEAFSVTMRKPPRKRPVRSVRRYLPIAVAAAFVIAATLVSRQSGETRQRAASTPAASEVAASTSGNAPVDRAVAAAAGPLSRRTSPSGARTARVSAPAVSAPIAPRASAGAVSVRDAYVATEKSRAADVPRSAEVDSSTVSSQLHDSLAIGGRVVTASTGRPIASATVTVVGVEAGTTTDSSGAFTISGLPPGRHTIMARRIGYGAARMQVNVSGDSAASVTVALPQSVLALSEVVVAGAAAVPTPFVDSPPTITGARLVSSELSEERGTPVRRTTYELSPGTQVTLLERRATRSGAGRVGGDHVQMVARADGAREREPVAAMTPGVASSQQAMHSVSWAASDGAVLVLSGAMPIVELEALRNRIVR